MDVFIHMPLAIFMGLLLIAVYDGVTAHGGSRRKH